MVPFEFAVAFGMILASAGGSGLTVCDALDPEGTQPL